MIYDTANLLLRLRFAPKIKRQTTPMIHSALRPPNKLTPPDTPNLSNIGGENKTAEPAKRLRASPFAANRDPA